MTFGKRQHQSSTEIRVLTERLPSTDIRLETSEDCLQCGIFACLSGRYNCKCEIHQAYKITF